MKNLACLILTLSIFASCESPMEKPLSKQLIANDTTIPTVDDQEPPQYRPKTHLQDTT
jgi:hypothetical protein